MTVSTQVSRNEYTGNGATTQYDFTFRILDKSHLLVQTLDTSESIVTLTLGTDYTVTGVNRYNGGKVVLTSALPTGYKISIERSTPVTQEASIRNQGGFFPEIHEDAFDKLTMLVQQAYGWWSGLSLRKPSWLANYYDALNNRIRNLRDPSQAQDAATKGYADNLYQDAISHSDSNFKRTLRSPEPEIEMLPGVAGRKNKILAFNDQGNPISVLPESGSAADVMIEFAKSSGAGLSGFDPFLQYPVGTVGEYLAQVPLSDNKGVSNSLSAFNATIKKLALQGGGTIKPDPGIYLISGGSILLPSNISLDLRGVTLKGDGTNTLIKSGAIVGGELVDITTEYGTGSSGTGSGTHYVWRSEVVGGVLQNAGLGIRGHRLNNSTVIRGVTFENTLTQSWVTSHSWGLKITECTVWAPAIMKDFVDWTEVSGNNFEGNDGWNDNYAALTITTGGYGGSYSARLISNGFHRMHIGVNLTCEMANLVVEDNHFEAVVKHIVGDNNDKRHFRIKNNWMKANLLTAQAGAAAVTPMTFGFLRDSEIGPNRFTHDSRSPDYDFYINASGSNVFGNEVFVGYKTDSDFSKYNLNETNILRVIRGSNLSAAAFPEVDIRSGKGSYTFEKYKSDYNYINNSIPNCSVTISGTTCAIKTWVKWSTTGAGGCPAFLAFHLNFLGSTRSIKAMGRFGWQQVVFDVNKEIYGGTDVVTAALSTSEDGYVVITFSGVASSSTVNGWIKAI
ncbi:phage tail fiber protein [Klebsiella pneumoniae]